MIDYPLSQPIPEPEVEYRKSYLEHKVHKLGNDCGCWLWDGIEYRGYGKMRLGNKSLFAHRVSYALYKGVIPDGIIVRHTCDTPLCVNPNHLILGTQKDNRQDAVLRGRLNKKPNKRNYERGENHWMRRNPERILRGEAKGNAKLDDERVRAIRVMHAGGMKLREIAPIVNVAKSTVWLVVTGRYWGHVK